MTDSTACVSGFITAYQFRGYYRSHAELRGNRTRREAFRPFDCIFFDADRVSAPDQLTHLLPKLTPDGMLLADDALSHREEIAAYLEAVAALPDFGTVIIPVSKGLSVVYRYRDGER